ncbi:Binding-protein-dependent transport systems inner membrane component [Hoyosella subflava DQS3-9A1]|uniref:Binding-protein-dependent transport systems inner membrane component n=1 Tax=Hoyosella subflava (strain DSM 45089 / JCM 17490 / NBRC 109087 / DQS3-9A1) TaxID=443218 RepID=F6EPP9_HOYSD|nr:Binding-protein-dependent transport systems inner membrane component [Hoyosella subflava DQS3-9A1]
MIVALSTFSIPSYLGTFTELLGQHLYMALTASLLGLVISLPAGLACVRWPRLYPPVLAVASVLYSIPSLAFFVLLISFTGITPTTVILPLALYTLSGLIPNVVDGLRSVPAETRQAATAMGMRRPRQLVTIELPLAFPAVMAGLRVATVANISMVSVGALIGMGAFGSLFTAAAQLDRVELAVTGILITIVMALTVDLALLAAQWYATPWTRAGGSAPIARRTPFRSLRRATRQTVAPGVRTS